MTTTMMKPSRQWLLPVAFGWLFLATTSVSGFAVRTDARARTLGMPTPLFAASGLPRPSSSPSTERRWTEPVADVVVTKAQRRQMEDVMIEPDYTLTWSVAALCPLILWYHPHDTELSGMIGVGGALFHLVFAALLWVQTRRVRCVFEEDAFEFYNIKGPRLDLDSGAQLTRKPHNYVSNTVNRWSYDSITNYAFFPSIDFPVICYFKETETPVKQWNRWFAAFDFWNAGGQPHFFPGLCSARQWRAEMQRRGVKRKPVRTLQTARNERQQERQE